MSQGTLETTSPPLIASGAGVPRCRLSGPLRSGTGSPAVRRRSRSAGTAPPASSCRPAVVMTVREALGRVALGVGGRGPDLLDLAGAVRLDDDVGLGVLGASAHAPCLGEGRCVRLGDRPGRVPGQVPVGPASLGQDDVDLVQAPLMTTSMSSSFQGWPERSIWTTRVCGSCQESPSIGAASARYQARSAIVSPSRTCPVAKREGAPPGGCGAGG